MCYALARGFSSGRRGMRAGMTVTDPDVPDPLNDPRTTQADPGAYGEGADVTGGAFSEAPPA